MTSATNRLAITPVLAALALLLASSPCRAMPPQVVEYPGTPPGVAQARIDGDGLILENAVIRCVWSSDGGSLRLVSVTDRRAGRAVTFDDAEVFEIAVPGKGRLAASAFALAGKPQLQDLDARADSPKLAERFPGKQLSAVLRRPDENLEVHWRAELRDQGNAVRQAFTLRALGQDVPLGQVSLIDLSLPKAAVVGSVAGSPAVSGNLFFALEHPKSVSAALDGDARNNLALGCPVTASAEWQTCKAMLAVDGDYSVHSYWGATDAPVWLQVDLEAPVEINKIRLVTWHNNARVYQYRIETAAAKDGPWTVAVDASKNTKAATAAGDVHRFEPRKARFVKVTILNNSEGNQFGGHIVELEVFHETAEDVARQKDEGKRIRCSLARDVPLLVDRPVTETSVIGVVPKGQLRRGFLYYVERERAHPYRPFLHYNSWYDVAWVNRFMSEGECVEAIEVFGRELTEERGVRLASFVFDDGWDDPKTLWKIDKQNFPRGFAPLLAAARRYDSTLGTWFSPWGGYGRKKEQRLQYGREQGFEINASGFSMAGEKYFGRFLETSLGMIRENGVNFFKYDGMSAGDINETDALIRLTRELRRAAPDVFISETTGTWPSAYWLWLGDSTWRGAGDMGFHGAGSKRQQWITYRDLHTYHGVVLRGPLYPINSLMTQGVVHAQRGFPTALGDDPEEIRREFRSFFASGTCLQELYITPQMMTEENWDDLAEAVRWSHANADVLVDTHWTGGDPGKPEPYGWASWSRRKGILALRNPSDQPAKIAIDVGGAFELPAGAPRQYTLRSPWRNEADRPAVTLRAGEEHTFELAPFDVLVFDAAADEKRSGNGQRRKEGRQDGITGWAGCWQTCFNHILSIL